MTGYIRQSNIACTDTTLPKTSLIDRIINPDGALALFDLAHTYAPTTGVPTNGAYVDNIAGAELAALTSATGNDLKFQCLVSGVTGTTAVIERTGKGALHGIMTQSAQSGAVFHRYIMPAALRTYLLANPTNDIAVAMCYRVTRAAADGSINANVRVPKWTMHNSASAVSNNIAYLNSSGHYPTGATLLGQEVGQLSDGEFASGTPEALEPTIAVIGVNGWTGSVPGSTASLITEFGFGTFNSYTSSTYYNKHPSYIIYWFYIEDLTVSGRTYADVAMAAELKFASDFATTGRFYNDTFTAPAI